MTSTTQAAFDGHLNAARRRLEQLAEKLTAYGDEFAEGGAKNWALVGSVAHVNTELAELAEFLGCGDLTASEQAARDKALPADPFEGLTA